MLEEFFICQMLIDLFALRFQLQLRKPVSTHSIPGSMKTPCAGNRDTVSATCNEEAGIALVGVRSEYPRYVIKTTF